MDAEHYMGYGYGWLSSAIHKYRRQAYGQWNTGGGMNCAVISRTHSYYWKTVDCSTVAGFICRKEPAGMSSSPPRYDVTRGSNNHFFDCLKTR